MSIKTNARKIQLYDIHKGYAQTDVKKGFRENDGQFAGTCKWRLWRGPAWRPYAWFLPAIPLEYPIQLPTHLTTVLSLSLRGISASQALGFNPTHCKSQPRILGISIRHLSLFNDYFSKVETAFQILSMKLEFTVKKQFRISCKIQGWKSPFLPC